jgi:hypothetical protein
MNSPIINESDEKGWGGRKGKVFGMERGGGEASDWVLFILAIQ